MSEETHCPLCLRPQAVPFFKDKRRSYLRCWYCALVFVPPTHFLSAAAERAEYELHRNAVDDAGYRAFLSRLCAPLVERLPVASCGIDFGCGPGPALASMLREAGHRVSLYDPFFVADEPVLTKSFDFICATEVVEHLHKPGPELERLWSLLRPGGWLGIMTKLVLDREAFAHWHYKNDPTHVCFFSVETWRWWAQYYGGELEIIGADVVLLRRPD